MEYRFLNDINSPADLRRIPDEDIPLLAAEIRGFLINNVTETGGHLASNLGVVELTLALHRAFDFSTDHLIFDVGHQSYVHKLITGRRERFDSLRKIGGLSGFEKRSESDYDAFGAGHSSTSLSAALGFAYSDKLAGSPAYTVAVVGDGAYTGGMIHEAINNMRRDLRLIIILNENEMSISKNIGKFAKHIARLRTSKSYYRTKRRTARFLYRLPIAGPRRFRCVRRFKQVLKNAMYGSNYFEDMGLYYLGPVDGNDYEQLSVVLDEAKRSEQSVIVHVKTVKGKGYAPAEVEPNRYHSIAPAGSSGGGRNFSAEFGDIITELADDDSRICAITASMGESTGLGSFAVRHKKRFYDVGIAEAHAVTFAAGLAANDYRPIFAVYSSFLQRSYDNILHDVALQGLPVVIAADRAGLSAADGPTHHGIFDVAFVSHSGMKIYAPVTFRSLRDTVKAAVASGEPTLLRYANSVEPLDIAQRFFPTPGFSPVHADFSEDEAESKDVVIITYGRIASEAIKLAHGLGDGCGILLLEQLTPYRDMASEISRYLPKKRAARVLIWEEGIYAGGFGVMMKNELEAGCLAGSCAIRVLAVKEPFRPMKVSGNVYDAYGIGMSDALDALAKDQESISNA